VFENFESHQIKGYETWKVILTKTGSPVQKISQLFVPNETASGLLNRDELAPVKCSQCNITRYFHHQRGVMQYKRDAFDPDLDIIRSYEWFGSGRDGYQEVFVSNRVIKLIIEYGWKGVRFKVVKLV